MARTTKSPLIPAGRFAFAWDDLEDLVLAISDDLVRRSGLGEDGDEQLSPRVDRRSINECESVYRRCSPRRILLRFVMEINRTLKLVPCLTARHLQLPMRPSRKLHPHFVFACRKISM